MSWISRVTLTAATRDEYRRLHRLKTEPYRQHQTLWQMFEKPVGASQPFLFRQESGDDDDVLRFLVVSHECPREVEGWRVESKPYQPKVDAQACYRFGIRLNPTRTEKSDGKRGKRQDYVISRLHQLGVPRHARPAARQRIVQEELPEWLEARSVRHGFTLERCTVVRYERFTAHDKGRDMTISVADFAGVLRVTDPEAFGQVLLSGLGHAKSFGCGLLLLKPIA